MPERTLTQEDIDALPPEVRQAMGLSAKPERPATPEEIAAAGVEVPPPPPPKGVDPGRWSAFWRNALAGFFKQGSDEASGLITQAAVDPGAGWRQPDGSVKYLKTANDVYRAGRDTERRNLENAREFRPGFSFAGNVAGDVASDAVLRAAGVPVLSSAYQTASGAISGLLGGEAELTGDKRTPQDVARAGLETGIGAGLGYLVPKVAQGAGRVVGPLLRRARAGLEAGAVGLGRRVLQGGSDLAGARFREVPADAILEAIRSGAILPFGTTQGAFRRLERLGTQRGDAYGALLGDLEDLGFQGPNVQELADSLATRASELGRETITSGAPPAVLRRARDKLLNLARGGDDATRAIGPATETLPLRQAEAVKRTAQSEANYGLLSDTPVNEAKQDVASRVRQAIEDSVEAQGRQFDESSIERTLAESFVPQKQQLARTLAARNLAEKGNTRVSGRNTVGLREALIGATLGGGGLAAGGDPVQSLVGGLGTAAALSLAGRRLPSTGASALYGLSRAAGAGARAAARNPTAAGLPVAKGASNLTREQLLALADYLTKEKK